MAFADPQSVTINAVAQSMPRVNTGVNQSTYRKDDGTYSLVVSHQYGKRTRRQLRLDNQKIAPDPFTADNTQYSATVYLVVDVPSNSVGYTNAELKLIIDGFLAYMTASSGAKITQLLGGEN